MSAEPLQQSLAWGAEDGSARRLMAWPPDLGEAHESWRPALDAFLASPTGSALSQRIGQALSEGRTVYPPEPFKALSLTPLGQVRVVILGQDPYHGPGQAEGLAFSVPPGVRVPPSLRNVFKELQRSLGLPVPAHGSLVHWARQGVLLLNTCLTVEKALAASHAGWGWEVFTDALVLAVASQKRPVVFMLWGAHAQAKKHLIEAQARAMGREGLHKILEANHPSPLSASRPPRPFLGCNHFAQAREFADRHGEKAVKW